MPGPGALFLVATLLMLAAGPALVVYARGRPRLTLMADRFVLVCVVALVAVEVAPDTVREGGVASLAFIAVGMLGPTLLEHAFRSAQRLTHLAAVALAVAGLVLHALADGTVLAAAGDWALPLAVVLHTLPVAMATWWVLAPHFGAGLPVVVLATMGAATLGGFLYGVELSQALGGPSWAWFQALVAGSILHVVFGRPHLEPHAHG